MQELDASGVDGVSGALSLIDISVSWLVGRALDYTWESIVNFADAGGVPDYSRTTPMGDMY